MKQNFYFCKFSTRFLLSALCLFTFGGAFSQSTFGYKYGVTAGSGWYHPLEKTYDGGYVAIGFEETGVNNYDFFLFKVNENGDTLWAKTFGGPMNDWGFTVHETSDHGFILMGTTISFGAGNIDALLVKTDSTGNVTWSKSYGGPEEDHGRNAIQTSDGGFLLAGQTFSFGALFGDAFLIKTDAAGDTLWTKMYGGSQGDAAWSMVETSQHAYVILGATNSFGFFSPAAIYLAAADQNGNFAWTKTFSDSTTHGGFVIDKTSDGGFIISGDAANGGEDAYLLKLDSLGDMEWNKTYGKSYSDLAYTCRETNDHGFILTGLTTNPSTTFTDLLIIKTDSSGTMMWNNTIGDTAYERGLGIEETSDGGYMISGEIYSQKKIYVLKTDSLGRTGCNESPAQLTEGVPATQISFPPTVFTNGNFIVTDDILTTRQGTSVQLQCSGNSIGENSSAQNFIHIFPNPSSGTVSIVSESEIDELNIYNAMGQLICHSRPGKKTYALVPECRGVYFLSVQTRTGITTQKVIVQD